jgi:hypothetical protein
LWPSRHVGARSGPRNAAIRALSDSAQADRDGDPPQGWETRGGVAAGVAGDPISSGKGAWNRFRAAASVIPWRVPAWAESVSSRPTVAALTVTLAFGAPLPSLLHGEEALHLTWVDCWAAPAATHHETSSCATNSGDRLLVVGFTLSVALDSVIAIEAVIDLVHEAETLPPWWRLEPGGCREGALDATADLSALDGCVDMWQGSGHALVQDYQVGEPRGGANQARIKVVAAVPSSEARLLGAGVPYAAVALRLDDRATVGGGACAGCSGDACLVLNSILVKRLPGGTGDAFLQVPAAGDGHRVTWGAGTGANCVAVPARGVTWGRVKTLYR